MVQVVGELLVRLIPDQFINRLYGLITPNHMRYGWASEFLDRVPRKADALEYLPLTTPIGQASPATAPESPLQYTGSGGFSNANACTAAIPGSRFDLWPRISARSAGSR